MQKAESCQGKVLCRSFAKQVSEQRQIAHKTTTQRGPPEQSESRFEHLGTTESTSIPLSTLKGGALLELQVHASGHVP